MAKGKPSKIQRPEALKIARKLGAEIKDGAKHTRALVYRNGALIAAFGIGHGRKSGHWHIPRQLFVSETEALAIATCSMEGDEYFDLLDSRGKLSTIP